MLLEVGTAINYNIIHYTLLDLPFVVTNNMKQENYSTAQLHGGLREYIGQASYCVHGDHAVTLSSL